MNLPHFLPRKSLSDQGSGPCAAGFGAIRRFEPLQSAEKAGCLQL